MNVRHQAAAKTQDHRPVPFDQDAERLLTALAAIGFKSLEQLGIGQCSQRADAPQHVQRLPFPCANCVIVPPRVNQNARRPTRVRRQGYNAVIDAVRTRLRGIW